MGGTAVLLLILRYPIAGLGLALLAGPFGAWESLFFGQSVFDSGQLFLLLTVAAWLLRGLYQKRIRLPKGALIWPLFLFIAVAWLSLLDAFSLASGGRELIKWLEIWVIIVIVLSELEQFENPRRYIQLLLSLFLLSGLVQALIGIWQFGLRGTGPEHFVILGNYYRAYGSFEQPNPFAGLMHMTALLALGLLISFLPVLWRQLKKQRVNWQLRKFEIVSDGALFWLFVALCGGTAVLALVFSWSRGAWLGFGAGAAAIALFWPRQRGLGLLGLFVLVGMFLMALQLDLLPESLLARLAGFGADFQLGDVRGADINDSNYAVLERLAHWQTAVEMAKDQIWLGVGFGNYEPAYTAYALINWPDPLGHAHNTYLNILAETGIIGLSTYILFWLIVIWQTIQQINRHSGLYRGVMLGLLGCWLAIAVHHLVDNLYVNNLYIQLGVMLGLWQTIRTSTP